MESSLRLDFGNGNTTDESSDPSDAATRYVASLGPRLPSSPTFQPSSPFLSVTFLYFHSSSIEDDNRNLGAAARPPHATRGGGGRCCRQALRGRRRLKPAAIELAAIPWQRTACKERPWEVRNGSGRGLQRPPRRWHPPRQRRSRPAAYKGRSQELGDGRGQQRALRGGVEGIRGCSRQRARSRTSPSPPAALSSWQQAPHLLFFLLGLSYVASLYFTYFKCSRIML